MAGLPTLQTPPPHTRTARLPAISNAPTPGMGLAKSLHSHMPGDTHHAVAAAEQTMQRIIEAITPVIGPDFFRSLARHLTNVCHVDFACIVMVDQADQAPEAGPSPPRTRASSLTTFSYDLRGTPCENVVSGDVQAPCHARSSARFQPTSGSWTWASTATWECRCTDPAESHSA